ncbi:hypothetical protein BGZ99_001466 [Dissophora globulifera]|uniref:Enoyl reductase (ER) domain-containing protein n=1 Tax=Dissophora globulifera TaxID=979702 RepID=A0A9P6RTF7_9FUNG|nr:hypothetical protein BGZ99_001466 [Dissophora globulifera]
MSRILFNKRVIRAKYIPHGEQFKPSNVRTETSELNVQLKEGEILLRNLYIPLDPYNGPAPSGASSLNKTVVGFGLGEVIESKNSAFPVKSIFLGSSAPWELYTVLNSPQTQGFKVPNSQNPEVPLTEYTNALGINGLTAYAAVETLVKFKKDQPVYVSSAAGPVGSFVGILAKRAGAFVIGSAGSDEKVNYLLNDLGFDAAFNYKTKDSRAEIDAAAPQGIEIFFDLVGGETLDIGLEKLKVNGQVVSIGNISTTTAKTPYVTKNLNLIIGKALTVNGFGVFHHLDKFPQLWKEFSPLIASGEIKTQQHTVVKGLENAGQAFADYLDGKFHGKVIVEVATV